MNTIWKKIGTGKIGLPLAAASLFAVTAVAPVAANDWKSHGSQRQSTMQSSQTREISGEIIAKKQVNVPDQFHDATVVMVRTDDGRRVIVDLGSAVDPQLRRANLQEGDQITARGRIIAMGSRQILAANQLQVDGQRIQIDRASYSGQNQRSGSQRQDSRQSRMRQVTGTVTSMRQFYIEGFDRPLTFVTLTTDDGDRALVNLGWEENAQLREADVRLGERVAARGNLVRMGKRIVLDATQLRSNGQTYALAGGDQEQSRQTAGRSDGPQSQRSEMSRQPRQPSADIASGARYHGRQQGAEGPRPYETIYPDISAPGTSNAGTQSERVGPSGVPLPQGSPFAGTVEMGRAHPTAVAKQVEMALEQRGFNPGEIDGNLDEDTREALKEFQRETDLEVTGTVNQATARELGVDLAGNGGADFGASDRR